MIMSKAHNSLCLSKIAGKTRDDINLTLKQVICLILG